jgi:hypothetical protein
MYKSVFNHFFEQLNAFVQYIHNEYVQRFVLKQQPHTTVSKHLWFHICRMHHQIYIPSLSTGEKTKITRKVVWDYFMELEPAVLMFALKQMNSPSL